MKPQQTGSVFAVVGGMLVVVLGIVALAVGAFFLWGRSDTHRSPPTAVTAPGLRPTILDGPGISPPARATEAAVDYFRDASTIPLKLKEKVGAPPRLLELSLYPMYAFAEIQDPRKKENVDRYSLRNGRVGDGEPVELMGPHEANLESNLFDLEGVDFGAVPRMAADALARLALEDGKVSHMILRRGLPFHQDVRWRVYVSSPRKSGSVEYDPQGGLKKVWK